MIDILFLLAAAVVSVLISTRLGLGSILGYIAGGLLIGPHGIGLITDADNLRHIGEFGVVFLLFMIGLEMKPRRLWVMRRMVFGMGGLQVVGTGLALAAAVALWLAPGMPAALVVGFGLALSSTAIGIGILTERGALHSHYGRGAFAVLLFQDLAVLPMMVVLPVLAARNDPITGFPLVDFLAGAGIVVAAIFIGRLIIGPVLQTIARIGNVDTFVALALLLVLGFAWIMQFAGLSLALGAFIAGMLLADSEYRHQIEADIMPFRGLLLGLFFMSVGMSLDPSKIVAGAALIFGGVAALMTIKTGLMILAARIFAVPLPVAIRTGFLLSQAGEFAFVVFTEADELGILPPGAGDMLIAVTVLSMAITPLFMWLGLRLADRLEPETSGAIHEDAAATDKPVLIAGFGRVGETVASMLEAAEVPYIAIDSDADRVGQARRRGFNVFFGSAARPEVLRSVGGAHARLMVVTLDDPSDAEALVRCARRLFPDVPVHVRVRDWDGADAFTALGVEHALPETVEASLRLGAAALEAAGVDADRRRSLFEDLSAENYAKLRAFRRH